MIDFLMHLQWWHWWIAAAVIAAIETFLPGAVAIWFAASAAVVGALVLILPVPWQLQLLLFGVLGIVAVILWRRYDKARPDRDKSDQPLLNQRALQYIGRESNLSAAIVNGRGKVYIGDGAWTVRGPDLPAGARVRVVGAEGTILVVEAA
jgi:membrane protein implicated in regulation of membrane protease activity